jgi:hypothetical protein
MIKKSGQNEERLHRIEQQLKDLRKETAAMRNHDDLIAAVRGLLPPQISN